MTPLPPTPGRPSLLGVFAHPDDESLPAGGVLAQHAAAGAVTAVVTATWSPDSHRAAELADALKILGAGDPRMVGYADAHIPASAPGRPRLCDAPIEEVVEMLVGHIRAVRPQLVVTHDAYGQLTGHPDHVRTHQAAVLAFHAAGRPRAALARDPRPPPHRRTGVDHLDRVLHPTRRIPAASYARMPLNHRSA